MRGEQQGRSGAAAGEGLPRDRHEVCLLIGRKRARRIRVVSRPRHRFDGFSSYKSSMPESCSDEGGTCPARRGFADSIMPVSSVSRPPSVATGSAPEQSAEEKTIGVCLTAMRQIRPSAVALKHHRRCSLRHNCSFRIRHNSYNWAIFAKFCLYLSRD